MTKSELEDQLTWLRFAEFWAELGRAAEVKVDLDWATNEWNNIRKCYSCKGRPKGSKNKPKLEDKAPNG